MIEIAATGLKITKYCIFSPVVHCFTQKELARLTHTSEAAVCKWLSGTHNFTFSTIGKISAALGATIINVPASSYGEIIDTAPTMVAEDDVEYL